MTGRRPVPTRRPRETDAPRELGSTSSKLSPGGRGDDRFNGLRPKGRVETPPFRETDGSALSAAAATPAVAVADENRPDTEAEPAVGVVIIAEAEMIRVTPVGV